MMRPSPRRSSRLRWVTAALACALLVTGAPPAPVGAAGPPPAGDPVALVVRFEPGLPVAAGEALVRAAGAEPTATIEQLGAVRVEVPAASAASAAGVQARLAGAPGVVEVRPERTFRVTAFTPNDPLWSEQWGAEKVRAPEAWDVTLGSPSIVVAVLDTGVQASHPDLSGALVPGRNIISNNNNTDDDNGHGTAVAGIVAARTNNGEGIAGICGQCRVMPVKVLASDGEGGELVIANGMVWAADNGAHVINLSLSGKDDSSLVQAAAAYARDKGVLVIAAAGNEGESTPKFPGSNAEVVGVAGSTETDARHPQSNFGSWVDVAAPFCNPAPFPTWLTNPHPPYGMFCGTSSASPIVAGLAGLALSEQPLLEAPVLEAALRSSAVPVGSYVQYGRVDAAALLDRLALVVRAAGSNRIATAVAISKEVRDSAPAVVLARSDGYADALAAAPLAAKLDAPILLTTTASLPAAVRSEVIRLGATSVHIVGGTGAVSEQVVADLNSAGVSSVTRVAGVNRFDTAAQIAALVGGKHVYVTEGFNADPARGWPDAVAVSGLAAFEERPILLAVRDELPAASRQALIDLDVTHATMIGGTAALGPAVEAALQDPAGNGSEQVTVDRISGSNRWETSRKIADAAVAAGALPAHTWLATGFNWPDALGAGPSVGFRSGVLLLAHGTDLEKSTPIKSFLTTHASSFERVVLVGGTGALSVKVESQVRDIAAS